MEMDGLMLEVSKEQKNKGQKEDRVFSAEAYRKVVDEINDKFSLNINKSKVLNRLKTLKEQMVLAKEIEQKSGVGWNDITKTFEATTEVWKSICLANPKFKSIRGKHLYHLDILKEIYDKDMATGARVETANNEVHLENFNLFHNESGPTTPGSQAPPSSIPSVSNATSTKGKRLKTQTIADLSQDLKDMTMAMKNIANAIVSTSAEVWKTYEIRAALVKLGLPGWPFFRAMELLVANPTLVGVFFGLEEQDRLEWLSEKMEW
ncbi:hypothetical protein PIB30_009918 [Stylosanthes scabra]|uniref:Myb/SANT-like domain-containing protein n=1 Tax=Stylosanthes scabra TaxID=79078 RepID=A0ABU6S548_9FABA|nr:hypothetical protein [Stylosanthes scabra]